MEYKKCFVCDTVLTGRQNKFCSTKCKGKNKRKLFLLLNKNRICKICDVQISPDNKNLQFCSNICYQKSLKITVTDNKCKFCKKEFKRNYNVKRKFCSNECLHKFNVGENNPNYGNNYSWTEEQKQRAIDSWTKDKRMKAALRLINRLKTMGTKKTDTKIHLELEKILTEMGFRVIKEVIFPPYIIDCYLKEFYVGFEADGTIWHSRVKDKKRDEFIFDNYKLPLKRFNEKEILNKNNRDNIKEEILNFINKYSDSDKERRMFSPEKLDTVPSKKETKDKKNSINREIKIICKRCNKEFKYVQKNSRKRQYCNDCRYCNNVGWNKGLTKEIDGRIKLSGEKISKTKQGSIPWNKGLSKDTNEILKETGNKISLSLVGKNKGKHYEDLLTKNGFKKQVERIKTQKRCNICKRFSFFDICKRCSNNDNIIIECDGQTVNHSKRANEKRDNELLSLGVEKIIHIKSQEKEDIEKELEKKINDE